MIWWIECFFFLCFPKLCFYEKCLKISRCVLIYCRDLWFVSRPAWYVSHWISSEVIYVYIFCCCCKCVNPWSVHLVVQILMPTRHTHTCMVCQSVKPLGIVLFFFQMQFRNFHYFLMLDVFFFVVAFVVAVLWCLTDLKPYRNYMLYLSCCVEA